MIKWIKPGITIQGVTFPSVKRTISYIDTFMGSS